MNTELLVTILATLAIVGTVGSFGFEILLSYLKKKKQAQEEKTDIAGKIKSISASLSKSLTELVDMQEELKERIAFVEDLFLKAKQAEDIVFLNKQQLEVLNQILSSNL